MARTSPQHSKREVDQAGSVIVGTEAEVVDYIHALEAINNWRSSHSFPLNTFAVTLKKKGAQVDAECLVVQRIKRLPSITFKLRRFSGYRLSQIQDIGGCRAVLADAEAVRSLVDLYRKSDLKHKLVKVDDYLKCPQSSGYRSIHMIY